MILALWVHGAGLFAAETLDGSTGTAEGISTGLRYIKCVYLHSIAVPMRSDMRMKYQRAAKPLISSDDHLCPRHRNMPA